VFAQEILSEMNTTIEKLIVNAQTMNKFSNTEIVKEEIDSLQNTQEKLIAYLIQMDSEFKNKCNEIKRPNLNSASVKIRNKLRKFERLNSKFINKTAREVNLIHFEEKRNSKNIRIRKKRVRQN